MSRRRGPPVSTFFFFVSSPRFQRGSRQKREALPLSLSLACAHTRPCSLLRVTRTGTMVPSRRLQRAGAASRKGGEKRKSERAFGGLTISTATTSTTTTPTHHHRPPFAVLSFALLCTFALSLASGASASVVLTVSVAEEERHGRGQLGRDENLSDHPRPLSLASLFFLPSTSPFSLSLFFFLSLSLSGSPLRTQNRTPERQRHLRRHPGHAGGLWPAPPARGPRGPPRRRQPSRRLRAARRRPPVTRVASPLGDLRRGPAVPSPRRP